MLSKQHRKRKSEVTVSFVSNTQEYNLTNHSCLCLLTISCVALGKAASHTCFFPLCFGLLCCNVITPFIKGILLPANSSSNFFQAAHFLSFSALYIYNSTKSITRCSQSPEAAWQLNLNQCFFSQESLK